MLRIDHLKDRAHIVSEIKAHETQGEAGLHPTKRSNVEYRTLKHILRLIDNELSRAHETRMPNL